MTVTSGTETVKDNGHEAVWLRIENEHLRSENARLSRELLEQKRLLWSRSETVSSKDIEDFKERQSVWAYLARRAVELATCFHKSAGTLPKIESMTAMLRHSVSTAAETNLYHNPEISDAEKGALWEAYAEQLRFVEAIGDLNEPIKRRILGVAEKEASRLPPYEIEAAVLACYDELTAVVLDDGQQKDQKIGPITRNRIRRMTMAEAQQTIADRLPGRSPKAIENMVTRARTEIAEARMAASKGKRSRADDKAIAYYFAYHQACSRLHEESGDLLARVRQLLSRFK